MFILKRFREEIRIIRESGKDLTRDNFCAILKGYGIDAQMAPFARIEERVRSSLFSNSLGVIDIKGCPICWVNVRWVSRWSGDEHPRGNYYADYGIPDSRLHPNSPQTRLETIFRRTFPILGALDSVEWWGRNCDPSVISRLNEDAELKLLMIEGLWLGKTRNHVEVVASSRCRCWILTTYLNDDSSNLIYPLNYWNRYQLIAQLLLK